MKPFAIAQLSDLHLTGRVGFDPSYQKFLSCLKVAKRHAQFLLLTGDLVNDGKKQGYDWLFQTLQQTGLDHACLAGNHDVTWVKEPHLPYPQRKFLPVAMDTRLIRRQCFAIGDWRLICLNSAKAGHEHGEIGQQDLAWLSGQLTTPTPTIVALHHPPTKVGSAWIDALKLANAAQLLSTLHRFDCVRAVVCGHVHQAHTLSDNTMTILTCPAVSHQFLPFSDAFAQDPRPSGFRLLRLGKTLHTQVFRVINPKRSVSSQRFTAPFEDTFGKI